MINLLGWLDINLPLNPEICWQISLSLLHSLWQIALIACVLAIIVKLQFSAHKKYAIAMAALILVAAMPVINFVTLQQNTAPTSVQTAKNEFVRTGSLPLFPIEQLSEMESSADIDNEISKTPVAPIPSTAASTKTSTQRASQSWTVSIYLCVTILYLCGVVYMFVRLLLSMRNQHRLEKLAIGHTGVPEKLQSIANHAAASLGRKLNVPIAVFSGRGTAMVVGVLQPMILVNASLLAGLTPIQLEQILAHELAHIYRYDPLALLLQRTIESWLYFHPATWYISHQVSNLRELCCDEMVVGAHEKTEYAQTLVACAALSSSSTNSSETSSFALAATGNGAVQLRQRILNLIGPIESTVSQQVNWIDKILQRGGALASLAILLTICWYTTTAPADNQADDSTAITTINRIDDTQWKWQAIEPDELDIMDLLFNGHTINISSANPLDVRLAVDIEGEFCQFGQWHFGDHASTRVAIVIDKSGEHPRIFLDANRNRIIETNEEMTRLDGQTMCWISDLDVEVSANGKRIRSKRQIALTARRNENQWRISTLGHASGTIPMQDSTIAARRIDKNGNGLTNDQYDQVWLDLDADDSFDPLLEQFNVAPVLEINDQRYALRSDRLGHGLLLTAIHAEGRIQFKFQPNDKLAKLTMLQGTLRDENGLFIAINSAMNSITTPTGNYKIEHLVVELLDESGVRWRMKMQAGSGDTKPITVKQNMMVDVFLLEEIKFNGVVEDHSSRQGYTHSIKPYMYTANGLVVTDFICVESGKKPDDFVANQRTVANITVRGQDKDQPPLQTCSGFN